MCKTIETILEGNIPDVSSDLWMLELCVIFSPYIFQIYREHMLFLQ